FSITTVICYASQTQFLTFLLYSAPSSLHTPSLHDALPISIDGLRDVAQPHAPEQHADLPHGAGRHAHGGDDAAGVHSGGRLNGLDRKSTRLNSSHQIISYAVFCLKKKRKTTRRIANKNNYI